jgi:hypothetical protein
MDEAVGLGNVDDVGTAREIPPPPEERLRRDDGLGEEASAS